MPRSAVLIVLAVLLLSITISIIIFRPTDSAAVDGEAIFEKTCTDCHGKDGKGDPTMASVLKIDIAKLNLTDETTAEKSDSQLKKTVRDGVVRSNMRSFKNQLSEEEIAGLVKYIRSLKN